MIAATDAAWARLTGAAACLLAVVSTLACASTGASGVKLGSPEPPAGADNHTQAKGSSPSAARPAKRPLPTDVVERSALPISVYRSIPGAGLGPALEETAWLDLLRSSIAVCAGERHDQPADHYAQWRIVRRLGQLAQEQHTRYAVGLEMVQGPLQGVLSAFATGDLNEHTFLQQVQWQERWGFDFSLYRPLFESARHYGAELVALNARRELSRAVARSGASGLDDALRAELPEMDLNNAAHRQFFERAMGDHEAHGGMSLDNLYSAQVLWDESMAQHAAQWLSANAPARMLILAGSAHCQRTAIPARLERRGLAPVLSVEPVFRSQLGGSDAPQAADFDVLMVLED